TGSWNSHSQRVLAADDARLLYRRMEVKTAANATTVARCASSSGWMPTASRPPTTRYSAATAPPPAATTPGPNPPTHALTITAPTSSGRYGNLSNVRWSGRVPIAASAVAATASRYARARGTAGMSDAPEPVFILRLAWDQGSRASAGLPIAIQHQSLTLPCAAAPVRD